MLNLNQSSLAKTLTTDENNRHEDKSGRDHGSDPAATATDLRRILAASGGETDILAQHDALRQWAREQGRVLDAATYATPARDGGLEHKIWDDADRVIKLTYGGSFGRVARITRAGLALQPATPLDYLARWKRHNILFGDITRVLGIVEGRGGPQMVIAQTALQGMLPGQETVIAWLRARSYEAVPGLNHVYVSQLEGMALFDARPANFFQMGDVLVPFDVIPMPLEDVGL